MSQTTTNRRRRLPGTDLDVSPLCYGTVPFGSHVRGDDLQRLYDTFRAAGGNFFDTAHCYCFWLEAGTGCSERALGACMRRAGDRGQVIVATKGGLPSQGVSYPRPDAYLDPAVIAQDLTESLERLGLDRVDLYWLHRDDTRVPVGEIVTMLNAEVARGRVRYLGASNWTTGRLAQANAYAAAHGLQGFAASQPRWCLAQVNPVGDSTMLFLQEADRLWHVQSGLTLIPYSPTACGYFASNGSRHAAVFDNPVSRARLLRVQTLARELGATTNQIALAYVMGQPFPTIPILGTADASHLLDAFGALSLALTPAQVEWLRDG
ncbi:MAG: aldo/keto reductase [Lentisphaerae bacterium]|nr:aldo/keto reductase [Lentisphaerota bacterium]